MAVANSYRFCPVSSVVNLPIQTTGALAYSLLIKAGSGGLVVSDLDVPRYYVTAQFLKAAINAVAMLHGYQSAALMPIVSYLVAYESSTDPLKSQMGGMLLPFAVIPIEANAIQINGPEPTGSSEFKVWMVHNWENQHIGWYLNHEPLRETVQTPPEEWVCVNGHGNLDPDRPCKSCGGSIVK